MSICCCTGKPIATRPRLDNDRPILSTKVTIKRGSQMPSAKNSNHGDLFYNIETRALYYYNADEETYVSFGMNINTEDGAARPTFGNCRNCGAPVNGHKCEYCGTRY